jgi:hypothetical protein
MNVGSSNAATPPTGVFTPAPLPVYSLSDLYGEPEPYESDPPPPVATQPVTLEEPDTTASAPPSTPAAPETLSASEARELAQPDPFPGSEIALPPPPTFEAQAPSMQGAPSDSASPASNVFERYQKLFSDAETARDHESAILAAVDSAILGVPASAGGALAEALQSSGHGAADSTGTAAASEAATTPEPTAERPYRARLVSFDLERDIDWNEEAAKSSRARSAETETRVANSSSEPPIAEARSLPSDAPVARDVTPSRAAEKAASPRKKAEKRAAAAGARRASDAPGWSAFLGGLACALVVGFGLGFVTGRGKGSAESERSSAASVSTPRINAAAAAPVARAEPAAIPLLPGPEPSEVAAPAAAPATTPAAAAAPSSVASVASPAALATGVPSVAPSAPVKLPVMEFDSKSALAALSKAASRAGVCIPPGEPGGSVVATVTFGPNGRASDTALSGARFSGSYSSQCIRNILSEVKVRPFVGEAVTVRKTLAIQ